MMGIILSKDTRVLVQGITGKEGSKATEEMLSYGTHVSCGVTPGKGGMNVHTLPVFDTVNEAVQYDPKLNTSVLYVPPFTVYDAAIEAIDAGIKVLVIVTENVPIKDTAKLVAYAKEHHVLVIGPSSVGVLALDIGKLGSIGGSKDQTMYTKGNVGIISKSGGMCAETAMSLTQAGIGQSTVVGIGGDVILGSTFTDLIALFEQDPETKAIVMFGEIGGTYEEQVADMVRKKECTKPIVAYISGQFAESLGRALALGHAGAIIEHGSGSAQEKKRILRAAGIHVVDYHYEIPAKVKEVLK